MKTIKLNNGIDMPMIGIGTFMLNPDQAEESVLNSLKNGYRLIDTACVTSRNTSILSRK